MNRITGEDRLLRQRMRDDHHASSKTEAQVAGALGMSGQHLRNCLNPEMAAEKHSSLSVERYRAACRVWRRFSALMELNRSLGFATIPLKPLGDERDPLMRLAAVVREMGEASDKLIEAKRKDSDGGRSISIAEAREINKEFMDLFAEASACLELVLDEAGIRL